MKITELTISNENTLSSQLITLTGDSWNCHDFAMISGEPLRSRKDEIFTHLKTKMLFKIIN
jgi:hypothetical protein